MPLAQGLQVNSLRGQLIIVPIFALMVFIMSCWQWQENDQTLLYKEEIPAMRTKYE